MDPDLRAFFDLPLFQALIEAAPTLLAVGTILIVGLVLALIARSLVTGLIARTGLEAVAERAGVSRLLYAIGVKRGLARVSGNLVALAIGVATLAILADVVGLPGVADGLGVVIVYLPDLLVAAGLTLVAFVGADFASRLVERIGRSRSDLMSPKIASTLAYWVVLVIVLSMAVRNLGVETALFETLLSILIGAIVVAFAAVVAWSSRDVVEGVVKRQYARKHLQVGDRIRVGEVEGELEELDTLTAVIRLDDGSLLLLPGRRLVDEQVQVIARGE